MLLPKPVVYAALYDYDPMLQSPNPAGPDEELEFKEGDLIKVGRDELHGARRRPWFVRIDATLGGQIPYF